MARRARVQKAWSDGEGNSGGDGPAALGSNSLDRATFLDYRNQYEDVEREVSAAKEAVSSTVARRKGLRKTIKAAGIGLAMFDRALADANRSGEEREAEHAEYLRNMAWMSKPTGFQGGLDIDGASAAEMSEPELTRVDRDGFAAGQRGDRADSNSWTPGREEHQRWHSAWMRGQADKVTAEIKEPKEPDAPKRRGRPPKASPNGAQAASPVAELHAAARAQGEADGADGHRDHAARYPAVEYGHADYELGHAEGQATRVQPAPAPANSEGAAA